MLNAHNCVMQHFHVSHFVWHHLAIKYFQMFIFNALINGKNVVRYMPLNEFAHQNWWFQCCQSFYLSPYTISYVISVNGSELLDSSWFDSFKNVISNNDITAVMSNSYFVLSILSVIFVSAAHSLQWNSSVLYFYYLEIVIILFILILCSTKHFSQQSPIVWTYRSINNHWADVLIALLYIHSYSGVQLNIGNMT